MTLLVPVPSTGFNRDPLAMEKHNFHLRLRFEIWNQCEIIGECLLNGGGKKNEVRDVGGGGGRGQGLGKMAAVQIGYSQWDWLAAVP